MQNIQNEVMEAYCDCRLPWEEAANRRNLNFKASESLNVNEARKILKACVPDGYNEFNADLIRKLPLNSKVTIAREGSVCVYVTPSVKKIKAMVADEWNTKDGTTRIWWD